MQDWTKLVLNELSVGNSVRLVGKGNSMYPKIKDREPIIIMPYVHTDKLKEGDIVFVRINNKFLTHQILNIDNDKFTIGNIKRKIDGIVTIDAIYGFIDIEMNNESFTGLTVIEE